MKELNPFVVEQIRKVLENEKPSPFVFTKLIYESKYPNPLDRHKEAYFTPKYLGTSEIIWETFEYNSKTYDVKEFLGNFT